MDGGKAVGSVEIKLYVRKMLEDSGSMDSALGESGCVKNECEESGRGENGCEQVVDDKASHDPLLARPH